MNKWMFILSDAMSYAVIITILRSYYRIFGDLRNKNLILNIALSLMLIALGTIVHALNNIQIVYAVVFFALVTGYSFLYKMKAVRRVYSAILIYIVLILSEILFSLLLAAISNLTIEELQNNIVVYMLSGIFSKVIIYIIVKLISTRVVCKNNYIPKVAIAGFIVLPITSFAVLYFMSEYVYASANKNIQIICCILSILLIASNMVVFFIFDYISKQKDKEKLIEANARQLEYERQYYSDLYDKQVKSDKITHDLKNKFFALQSLMNTDSDRVAQEFESITGVFLDIDKSKITGNISIDSLLNNKLSIAKSQGISIESTSCISGIENIDPIDMCVILGNLLDNSIEACNRLDNNIHKYINLHIKQHLSFIKIILENSYNANEEKGQTVKSDKNHHGFGVSNVKELVNKYNGLLNIETTNNQFKVIVILDDSAQKNEQNLPKAQ